MNSSQKKITFIPFKRPLKDFASSRLRALYLAKYLPVMFPDKYSTNFDDPENADIIVINQSISDLNLIRVKKAIKRRKVFIIYDVVDRIYDKQRKAFDEIVKYADLITVANQMQLEKIIKINPTKKCAILPDGIDYDEQLDTTLVPFNGKIVWFGNYSGGNFDSSMWAIKVITLNTHYAMSVIGMKEFIKMKGTHVIEWKYDGFIKKLKESSICLLSHGNIERQKSNNRLLVSIANGVPAIVSGSSSYSDLLRKFHLNYAIVNNESELLNAIKILSDNKQRKLYLSEIQPYILERFNFNAIAKIFDQMIQKNLRIK